MPSPAASSAGTSQVQPWYHQLGAAQGLSTAKSLEPKLTEITGFDANSVRSIIASYKDIAASFSELQAAAAAKPEEAPAAGCAASAPSAGTDAPVDILSPAELPDWATCSTRGHPIESGWAEWLSASHSNRAMSGDAAATGAGPASSSSRGTSSSGTSNSRHATATCLPPALSSGIAAFASGPAAHSLSSSEALALTMETPLCALTVHKCNSRVIHLMAGMDKHEAERADLHKRIAGLLNKDLKVIQQQLAHLTSPAAFEAQLKSCLSDIFRAIDGMFSHSSDDNIAFTGGASQLPAELQDELLRLLRHGELGVLLQELQVQDIELPHSAGLSAALQTYAAYSDASIIWSAERAAWSPSAVRSRTMRIARAGFKVLAALQSLKHAVCRTARVLLPAWTALTDAQLREFPIFGMATSMCAPLPPVAAGLKQSALLAASAMAASAAAGSDAPVDPAIELLPNLIGILQLDACRLLAGPQPVVLTDIIHWSAVPPHIEPVHVSAAELRDELKSIEAATANLDEAVRVPAQTSFRSTWFRISTLHSAVSASPSTLCRVPRYSNVAGYQLRKLPSPLDQPEWQALLESVSKDTHTFTASKLRSNWFLQYVMALPLSLVQPLLQEQMREWWRQDSLPPLPMCPAPDGSDKPHVRVLAMVMVMVQPGKTLQSLMGQAGQAAGQKRKRA